MFLRLVLSLVVCLLSFQSVSAAPLAQGETRNAATQGCTYGWVENEKCEGGRCYGVTDCCGNGRKDLEFRTIEGVLIKKAETCDGEAYCRSNCTFCGDLNVDPEEECDKEAQNGQAGSMCRADCKIPGCGNSVREIENNEVCDGTDLTAEDRVRLGAKCATDCKSVHYCGNLIKDNDEICDFTGIVDNKVCKTTCDKSCPSTFETKRYLVYDGQRTEIAENATIVTQGGKEAVFEVELINPGCLTYSNISLTSTQGITYTLISGDTNGNNILDLNETWLYRSTPKTFTPGTIVIESTATGTAVTAGSPTVTSVHTFNLNYKFCGNEIKDNDDVCDFKGIVNNQVCKVTCDKVCPSTFEAKRFLVYDGTRTQIAENASITTQGGKEAVFEVELTNPGCLTYNNINVTSTQGITYTLISGDTNGNNILDLDETWLYRSTPKTFTPGTIVIENTATGTAVTAGSPAVTSVHRFNLIYKLCGNNIKDNDEVCDTKEVVNNQVCSISCDKLCDFKFNTKHYYVINNGARTEFAAGAAFVVNAGSNLYYEVEVSNPGCVTFNNFTINSTDGVTFTLISGDLNNNNILDLNETWLYRSTVKTTVAGNVTATITTTGNANTTPAATYTDTKNFSYNSDPCLGVAKPRAWVTGPFLVVPTCVSTKAWAQGARVYAGNLNGGALSYGQCWICAYNRGNGCFAPETRLALADGSVRAVEEIYAGDKLLNPVTGEAVVVKQIIESSEEYPIIEVTAAGRSVKVSQLHPFPTNRGYLAANELQIGDSVLLDDSKYHEITRLKELSIDPNQRVINVVLDTESTNFDDHLVLADGVVTGDLFVQQELGKAE